ncbi:MAG: c-type cytochrome [Acidobacteriota bacterium]
MSLLPLRRPASLLALLCAVALLLLFFRDQGAPWKAWQRQYLEHRRTQLTQELEAARDAAADDLRYFSEAVRVEEDRLAPRRAELDRLAEDLWRFERKQRSAEGRLGKARRQRSKADKAQGEAFDEAIRLARQEVEGFAGEAAALRTQIEAAEAGLTQARLHLAEAEAPVRRAEAHLEALGRAPPWSGIPVLRDFGPHLAVREVSPSGSGKIRGQPRVDRCVTCHLGALDGGAPEIESAAEGATTGLDPSSNLLFSPHPKLGTLLGEGSPHPYSEIGCTLCHGGEGRSTDFVGAGHRPRDDAQGERWRRELGWRDAAPTVAIRTGVEVQAGCVSCHGGGIWFEGAPQAAAGRHLVDRLGCGDCHTLPFPVGGAVAVPGAPKSAPTLVDVADKTSPAWAERFLRSPRSWSSTTWMPHFWDLREGTDPELQGAEIHAVVDLLWGSPGEGAAPPPRGDAAAGEILFQRRGCVACHSLDRGADRGELLASSPERLRGPNLGRAGSKLDPGWLYRWLLDPASHRADTPMPNLRLSDRDAADLVAYLATVVDPEWEGLERSAVDGPARDRLVRAHLEASMPLEASAARFANMGEAERNRYLGEQTLLKYGCHGCHDVPGDISGIPDGGDLTALGKRDEAPVELVAEIHPWDWGLSPGEAAALGAQLGGWVPSPARVPPPSSRPELAEGRAVLERHGCRACHGADSAGDLDPALESVPALDLAVHKLRPDWVFEYLGDPSASVVRPWLDVPMPTFRLSTQERNAVAVYFAARAGGPLLIDPPERPDALSLAVGRAVFGMLQCDRCHLGFEDPGGIEVKRLAPRYGLSSQRLRPDWTVQWILDPHRFDPGTDMPVTFATADGGSDASFLLGTLGAPMFAVNRQRLERFFATEDDLGAYLSDAEQVARALRDHLWALGPEDAPDRRSAEAR